MHGLQLLYRIPKLQVYQLVPPRSGDLRWLLLEKLHNASYTAYLDIQKTMIALPARVWWPKLAIDVKHFVAGYQVC